MRDDREPREGRRSESPSPGGTRSRSPSKASSVGNMSERSRPGGPRTSTYDGEKEDRVTDTTDKTSAAPVKPNAGGSDVPPEPNATDIAKTEKDASKPVEVAGRGLDSGPHSMLEESTESDVTPGAQAGK
ncbi:hypothetical protein MTO96_015031 [Rhipicephalus appendiculatus]